MNILHVDVLIPITTALVRADGCVSVCVGIRAFSILLEKTYSTACWRLVAASYSKSHLAWFFYRYANLAVPITWPFLATRSLLFSNLYSIASSHGPLQNTVVGQCVDDTILTCTWIIFQCRFVLLHCYHPINFRRSEPLPELIGCMHAHQHPRTIDYRPCDTQRKMM